MKVEQRKIEDVIPYPGNPRVNDMAVDAVARSIEAFGFRQPIVVDGGGVIVCGHTRRLAAIKLKLKTVPVHVAADLTTAQIAAYRIADNQTASIAEWDVEALNAEIEKLKGMDFDLELLGFGDGELDELLASCTPKVVPPDVVPEVPGKAVSKTGDVWLLGGHRLLCGDSTKAKNIKVATAGQLGQLVYTDPPYGVGYDGGTTVREKLAGDNDTSLYEPTCQMAFMFTDDKAPLYLWHAGVKAVAAASAVAVAGYEIRCELIWNKNQAQFGASPVSSSDANATPLK